MPVEKRNKAESDRTNDFVGKAGRRVFVHPLSKIFMQEKSRCMKHLLFILFHQDIPQGKVRFP